MAEREKTKGADPSNTTTTTTVTVEEKKETPARSPTVVLKLTNPGTDKKVSWEQNTVDNEHMNKKKSKCCCIYEKQKLFGESSDDDDDENHDDCTEHCRGHRSKKDFRKDHPDDPGSSPQGQGSSDPQAT